MSSTFRRKCGSTTTASLSSGNNSTILHNTKTWTGGTVLVSTGLRELDQILGYSSGIGQALGTCIYLEEDRWGDAANCLIRYWCAEVSLQ